MTGKPGEDGFHLQWFGTYALAVAHIDEYTAMLRYDPRLKELNLIVSRPRPEAGGYALYAIPSP
jgi:hypothetical protein